MRSGQEVWTGIKDFFTSYAKAPYQWVTVLELILFFFVIYFVLRTLYENNAKRFIPVYILLILCMGTITVFSVAVDALWFFLFVSVLSLFFLFIFGTEIKRSIYNANAGKAGQRHVASSPDKHIQRAEECINAITKAVFNLSKSNTGALIVLSNGSMPRDIIESGVLLNADISSQLIEGIFVPKAPLHDGAMLINGDKIMAAGCFLPLTQKTFPSDYGTRHRAGIGIAEVADVSTIIVSEETGIISYAQKRNQDVQISRYIDSVGLKRILKDYYSREFSSEGKKA